MDNLVEIVLQAIDNASSVFSSVSESASEIGTAVEESASEATSSFDEMDSSASQATGSIQDIIDYCQGIDGSGPRDAANGMDELDNATANADASVEDLGADLDIINAGMLLQTAEQISNIAGNAEGMAQEMNESAISVGQLATQTGIAEPQMVSLINTISNATFPNDEAMMYVKSLDQMGVSAENLGTSATNIDRINDAFGLGAQTTNSLAQELGVLGVDMNNVSSSFNALAYANSNTVGGMQNYYSFLRKYDAEFKELGFNVDQASVIIAAATQKFGGGRAALSGLSSALEQANGDTRALEQALGMEAGSIDNATQLTGEYEGQLMELAGEEAEHKTLLEQLGAAWEDFSLSMSGVLAPLGSAVGLIGEAGSFAMQINGLITLGGTLKGVVGTIKEFNIVEGIKNALSLESVGASAAGAAAMEGEAVAATTAEVGFWGMAAAELAALWPILAIIAAVVLLVAAVYEIGKAFGWWTDVGSMIDAIWAGIQRLWSAFINHPDVQAAIQAITGALQWLWGAIQNAGQAIMEFFGISTGGDFDVVRALIDGVGAAWDAIKAPIEFVIQLFTAAGEAGNATADAFGAFWNDTLVPFGEWLSSIFAPVWQLIGDLINAISPFVTNLMNAFSLFATGQMDLPTLIWTVLTTLFNAYVTIFSMIISRVASWGRSIISRGISAVTSFVSGIVNRIMSLPGRVYSILLGVVSRIVSAIQAWITSAKNKAQGIVDGVGNVLQGTYNAVTSALSNVAKAIVKPFEDGYNEAKKWWDKITTLNGALGGETAWGGETAYGGETTYTVSNTSGNVETTQRIILDFANVPSQIDTKTLIDGLSDRNVLRALTGNSDFQVMDQQAKDRLSLKVNRSRGL